jgi:hypothetical protein
MHRNAHAPTPADVVLRSIILVPIIAAATRRHCDTLPMGSMGPAAAHDS